MLFDLRGRARDQKFEGFHSTLGLRKMCGGELQWILNTVAYGAGGVLLSR
jgi:hypothetical protein